MMLQMRFDLRAPSFGAPIADIYRGALEMSEWAERQGFSMVALSEHHGSDDGYCPSPLVVAAAITARTTTLRVLVAALVLPLHDPVRLAEDLAVLDVVSGGRVDVVLGAGYVPAEFDMFGVDLEDRVARLEAGVEVLRRAWSGERFEHGGRTVTVTPRPLRERGPMLLLGGASPGAARRAARIADGFAPVDASLWPVYAAECERLGRPAIGAPPSGGPGFIHVTDDVDAAWERIAPHALHETNAYARWLAQSDGVAVYREFDDADALRASGRYAVMTPAECVEHVRATGELRLHPLMGGLPPDVAWQSLDLIEHEVLPALRG